MSDTTGTIEGYVSLTEVAPPGMVTLRCRDAAVMAGALEEVGLGLPGRRGRVATATGEALWMSPDEILLVVPRESVARLIPSLTEALASAQALVVDVSDARAMFRLTGGGAREVLSKLSPAELPEAGEVVRSRIGQVAAAFWPTGGAEITVVVFRSVSQYARDMLAHAARRGSEVF